MPSLCTPGKLSSKKVSSQKASSPEKIFGLKILALTILPVISSCDPGKRSKKGDIVTADSNPAPPALTPSRKTSAENSAAESNFKRKPPPGDYPLDNGALAASEQTAPTPHLPPSVAQPISTPSPTSSQTPTPTLSAPPLNPECKVIPGFRGDEPVYLPKSKVMLTRVAAPCTTDSGEPGHLASGGWMAMGFPCTGGEGRIDWKGNNYNAPKMVSFLLDTSCPMAPIDPLNLKTSVKEEAGLQIESPMIAFNPFVVQYWEVIGYQDADATFSVDLRIGKSLTTGWNAFIKQKPLKVLLIGRENAWVPGNHMYAVDADILWASKNRFTLAVLGARTLKDKELADIKSRCEALKPERECGKVF